MRCLCFQSTLAESFLCDLQDLEEDEDDELESSALTHAPDASPSVGKEDTGGLLGAPASAVDVSEAKSSEQKVEEDDLDSPIPDAVQEYEQRQQENYVGVVVSDLMLQPDFLELLDRVRALTPQDAENDNEELHLIEKCNERVIDIDKE
ncbi:snoRNA binding domain-containing protein [Toxoplasma gondii TgCatPRC2]|uniref:SnoRNA binding domain-containing protein n=2 Tax=Toxoplasma gondii TaxID=5811 RepID=A0A151HRY8_TOXGO|nr:snoRNA binding domain-containing protein [Toxoplasma gondii TgCatPRC2]